MSEDAFKMGTLYIGSEVLQYEKWMVDQAVASAINQLRKYKGTDGLLRPQPGRKGDFSLTLGKYNIAPTAVFFIGIPGRNRAPIIHELFLLL